MTSVSERGAEFTTLSLKRTPQLAKIINLAIENNLYMTVLACHGLIARRKIDNGQSSMTKANTRSKEESLSIGPAMGDGIIHALEKGCVGWATVFRVKPA